MKKTAVLVITALWLFSSCTMGMKESLKNITSNFGGLNREITVYNAYTGEKLYTYEGKAYITDDPKTSRITIVLANGKKVDIVGINTIIVSIEK
ncbi:MAG: hypothetical protein LBG87_02080 [Spirochaetaceae bacterium]|jgi:hypothetical protein|nr:hypothetical protein [Spirochaetaceae bacterium]